MVLFTNSKIIFVTTPVRGEQLTGWSDANEDLFSSKYDSGGLHWVLLTNYTSIFVKTPILGEHSRGCSDCDNAFLSKYVPIVFWGGPS